MFVSKRYYESWRKKGDKPNMEKERYLFRVCGGMQTLDTIKKIDPDVMGNMFIATE